MKFEFNSHDLIVQPKITLCKIDTSIIGFLDVKNLVISPTFCDTSELDFEIYESSYLYSGVVKYMTLRVDGFGVFEIQSADEHDDGNTKYKKVKAYSYEISLSKKIVTYKEQVFKLYDLVEPEKSLLGIISNQCGWTIGDVDSTLLNKYRTLEIDGVDIYSLLMSTTSKAYACYFVFDTETCTINCYDKEREVVNSGINLSFKNLINSIDTKSNNDDIVTALTVKGAEGVGISLVNPLGTDTIYDFSYFMTPEYWGMSVELQASITEWQDKISDNQETYTNLVLLRRDIASEQIVLDSDLKILKGELNSLLDLQSVAITANDNNRLAELNIEIQAKEAEIKAKEAEIENKNYEYKECVLEITEIVTRLSFKNNFTETERQELSYYMKSGLYENENFIFTSEMSEDRKIEIEQQLLEQGRTQLNKLSQPLMEFDVDIANFMFDKDYENFSKKVVLGNAVNLEKSQGKWVQPKMLKVVINYENSDNAKITLSDSYRLLDGVTVFADGFNDTVKATNKVSLSASLWDEPNKNGFYGKVNTYIDNALNLAQQQVVNADNMEITIGSYGLRGKRYDTENDTYLGEQIAILNNLICFTDDNWQSAKTALGKVTIGEQDYFGLVAEAVVGRFIAGDSLTIANANNTFSVDGSGAKLVDADFSVEKDNSRILISPINGFKIQKKNELTDTWEDVLSENTDGDIVANGLKVETGDIGGWEITTDKLTSPVGDYIGSDGTGKLSLLHWDNASATFDGNIYANNLKLNYGSEDYIFVDGSMSGGWLTDKTVSYGKLDDLCVNTLRANLVTTDYLEANYAKIEQLDARYVTAEAIATQYLISNTGVFSGQIKVGTDINFSSIFSELRYLDTTMPNAQTLIFHATGGFAFESERGFLNVDVPISARNISAWDITIAGHTSLVTLNVSGASELASANISGELVCSGDTYINGTLRVTRDGFYSEGVNQEIVIGDKTLNVMNGIIVSVS